MHPEHIVILHRLFGRWYRVGRFDFSGTATAENWLPASSLRFYQNRSLVSRILPIIRL